MGSSEIDFDITRNVRLMENLKCRLLSDTSGLFEELANPGHEENDLAELLSDMIFTAYILGSRLGISNKVIDQTVIKKLKLAVLENSTALYGDYAQLLKHFEN